MIVTQLPLGSTLQSVDYAGRIAKRSTILGASNVRCVPRALDKRLILAGLVVRFAEFPSKAKPESFKVVKQNLSYVGSSDLRL